MLFEDGDFILTMQVSVQLQYWLGNGAGSGKMRNSGMELARFEKDVRELHTRLVQQVSVALLASTFQPLELTSWSRRVSHILDFGVGHFV